METKSNHECDSMLSEMLRILEVGYQSMEYGGSSRNWISFFENALLPFKWEI